MKAQTIRAALLTLAIGVASASPQHNEHVEHGQSRWQDGQTHAYRIARVAPAAFPQLPSGVRTELEQRGCLVPQTQWAKQPENVISGAYRTGGNRDWAALCSRGGFSSVLVFWNGSGKMTAELGRQKDTDYLQAIDSKGDLGYSRFISTASPDSIRRRKENKQLGPFHHDGIEDGFQGKGSLIHYNRSERWIELEGAD